MDAERLVAVVVGAVTAVGAYSSAGGLLPFVAALSSLRVTSDGRTVRLRGLDAEAVAFKVDLVLCAVGGASFAWGMAIGGATCVALLIVWLGFRVEVRATKTNGLLIRRFLYVIPWRIRFVTERPRALVDGWGDWFDPEALRLECSAFALELGWSSRGSGDRADQLAAELNRPLE